MEDSHDAPHSEILRLNGYRTAAFGKYHETADEEGVDVGTDNETPVTEEYKEGNNKFTGTIHKVTVEVT